VSANGSNPRLDRIEKIIGQVVRMTKEAEAANRKAELANQKAHARFESNLRRWSALGVKEARNQRRRSAEMDKKFDKKMDQLASAQLINEEGLKELKASQALTDDTLRNFISSMLHPRNGH